MKEDEKWMKIAIGEANKAFKKGDWRSGYYRDQTFMMAIGHMSIQEMFAALYGHTDLDAEPASAGRQMGGHYATRTLDKDGNWKNLMEMKNSSADISCTSGQMPRLLGLAQASQVYRHNKDLASWTSFLCKYMCMSARYRGSTVLNSCEELFVLAIFFSL